MIFLLNGSLPWTDFGKKFKHLNFTFDDYLKERLKKEYQKESIDMCPNSLKPIFRKVMLLGFKAVPPYDEVIEVLKKEIIKEIQLGSNLEPVNHEFEWQNNIASRFKARQMR